VQFVAFAFSAPCI